MCKQRRCTLEDGCCIGEPVDVHPRESFEVEGLGVFRPRGSEMSDCTTDLEQHALFAQVPGIKGCPVRCEVCVPGKLQVDRFELPRRVKEQSRSMAIGNHRC